MRVRRKFLVPLLLVCVAAALLPFGLKWWYRVDDHWHHYSLIEDGLYMGGSVAKPPPGTKAVLNLCERPDGYAVESMTWEPIPDAEPAPSIDWLRRMVEIIDKHRQAGDTTYVHCAAGISRSGMVVTAYLMFKNHWTRDEALAFVKSRRPGARPNPAFMKRLLEWEREVVRPSPLVFAP
jgi:hypothetical protein